jgi:hypothetical protein
MNKIKKDSFEKIKEKLIIEKIQELFSFNLNCTEGKDPTFLKNILKTSDEIECFLENGITLLKLNNDYLNSRVFVSFIFEYFLKTLFKEKAKIKSKKIKDIFKKAFAENFYFSPTFRFKSNIRKNELKYLLTELDFQVSDIKKEEFKKFLSPFSKKPIEEYFRERDEEALFKVFLEL